MNKARDLLIENKLRENPQKLVKWRDHLHYFECGERALNYSVMYVQLY